MFDDFQEHEEDGSYIPAEPEGLLPARESSLFLGHESVEKRLLNLINSGNIPHAIIFSGLKGIGKSTMAFRLARYLLENGASDPNQDSLFGDAAPATDAASLDISADDPVFHKVASGGHPDLLTIERAVDDKKGTVKNTLDVDTARKVVPFLRMTSSEGGWRIVIVDDADTMNRNAQNALLKILEEPPDNTVLILISHRLGAMIPTIRSRCRIVEFDPLPEGDLTTLMEKEVGETLSAYEQKVLCSIANGSIGTARKIIESDGLETAQTILRIFERWPDFNYVDVHQLADSAGRQGQNAVFDDIERTFLFIFEKIIFAKAHGHSTLEEPLEQPIFQQILNEYSLKGLLETFEQLKQHFEQAKFSNLDKKLAVIEAFNLTKLS